MPTQDTVKDPPFKKKDKKMFKSLKKRKNTGKYARRSCGIERCIVKKIYIYNICTIVREIRDYYIDVK